ncbi:MULTISPECIES: glycosyltransferase [unclassified Pseudomonas]|uniref:glycosyltransferase n=1 Tax=unclassified Pseudomonas TaxID=196821 RepID=UPI00034D2CE9|nr:glycosyltransferase [Pseudomonas sp. Lz4W]MCH4871217.1 glycosyltransferase [Pseudomonas sp. TMW22089]NBG92835.1 glycosyltransferase family 4 protein [Pseudomonas sp. 9.1(2019)]
MTRVSLGRTAALAEAGVSARIAVLDFDERLDATIGNLVEQGRIPETLKVVNFYKWFACKALEVISAGAAARNDSNIEHLQVKVVRRIDHINGANISVVRYMTVKGYVYLEEFQNHLTGGVMVLISMPGKRPLKFNSLDSAHAYWLKCLSVECLPSFIVADSIGAADAVCSIEGDDIYRVLMMHSNHLLKPYRVGGAIAPKYHGVIRGISNCDRLVLLTRGQLHDMQLQFPSGRYSVIGNLITLESQEEPVLREANLAVIVSRLHGVKRIKSMVSAFAKVVAINPDARLEIWGSGDQEEEIKALILKLGMQDSIQVMGFATSVSRIFRRASVSLGMSVTEGFGISFAESLGYGTPLVSTRTNYGPQEIVADGEDGFIVDTEDEFVEKINLLLSNSALVSSMGSKGKLSAQRFASQAIVKLWLDLFDGLAGGPTGRQGYAGPEGEILLNRVSSKVGWIYLPEGVSDECAESYRLARKAWVLEVSAEREFMGGVAKVLPGVYEIDEMALDEVKGRYRFRLMKDGVSFRGVIASRAIKFIFS